MGYKKVYDVSSVSADINRMAHECTSPYNDGFVAWGIKQDLYRLKWILDDAIRRCPTFVNENEWLREQEQKKLIKYLSQDV